MRYIVPIIILLSAIACNNPSDKVADNVLIEPSRSTEPTQLQTTIRTALLDIIKKDIESNGNNAVKTLDISGMEIVKISKQEYYTNELKEQESSFQQYMKYISDHPKSKGNPNQYPQLEENKARHEAVINYLKTTIKTASTEPEVYRVSYYLKANTKNMNYTQPQTTYLDKDLKKIVANYSSLKVYF